NTGSASPFTAITGDRVDFVNDLGIKPRNNLTMPEVSFNFWGTQTLRVSYFALAQNATNTITRSFVFGGTTYTASDVVNTRFDLQMLRVRYEWGLLHFAPFSLAMGVGGDVIFVRAKIADQTSGEAADTGHQIGGTPIVSLRARFNLPAGFGIEAHAEGMYVGLGWLGRGEAGLDWQFLRYLSVQGGYRAEYVSVNMQDINGVSAGMRMQGAYVSATAWF
ncbi:MAG: hypothetical protein ACREJ2_05200, partial [Planctomycetota bacterium]